MKTKTLVTEFGLAPRKRYEGGRPTPVATALAQHWPKDEVPQPVVTVALADLQATQRSVHNSSIRRLARKPQKGYWGDEHPSVIKCGGVLFLVDGHHRACVALMQGRTTIEVRMRDLDDDLIRYALILNQRRHEGCSQRYDERLAQVAVEHGPVWPVQAATPEADAGRREAWAQFEGERAAARQHVGLMLTAHLSGVLAVAA